MLKHKSGLIVIGLVILVRLLVGITAELSNRFLDTQTNFANADIIFGYNLPNHLKQLAVFDGAHYLNIARHGYDFGLSQAFFPIYPLLIRLVSLATGGDPIVVGLGISLVSVGLGSLFWWRYFKAIHLSQPFTILAIWLLFPTSFYFFAVYTEGLFFMLAGLVFNLIHQKKFILAATVIGIASGVRLIGLVLILPLLYQYFSSHQVWLTVKIKAESVHWSKHALMILLLILISSLGLGVYSYYLNWRFHNPLLFLTVQSEFGAGRSSRFVFYPQVLWRAVKIVLTQRPINWRYLTSVLELLSGTMPIYYFLTVLKQKELIGLTLFSAVAFFLPTLTGNFSSMTRYILLCPALFVGISLRWQSKRWLYLWLSLSTILLLVCTTLFTRGYWVG